MLRIIFLFAMIALYAQSIDARIRYVDKNGGNDQFGHQKYTTIQAAVGAAVDGDTVRILPGIYTEYVNIGKNILVQGGGIKNTTIAYNQADHPAVSMTNGKLMWVTVTAYQSDGVWMSNATASNCLFLNCNGNGMTSVGNNVSCYNCLSIGNKYAGFYVSNNTSPALAINCIAYKNGGDGFGGTAACCWTYYMSCRNCCSFNNSTNYNSCNQTNCLSTDPGLSTDGDYRISPSSVCKDAGDPTILDLDGTSSDIGYYGGPDAPILPYITLPANFKLNPDTTIQFDVTGKVGY